MRTQDILAVECKICQKIFFVPKRKGMIRTCEYCKSAAQRARYLKWKLCRKETKMCKVCGAELPESALHKHQVYCGKVCRKIGYRKAYEKHGEKRRLHYGIPAFRPNQETKFAPDPSVQKERDIEARIRLWRNRGENFGKNNGNGKSRVGDENEKSHNMDK